MISVAELVTAETGLPVERIMLLRHSSINIEALRRLGGTVEEYTEAQPVGGRYDYHRPGWPKTEVVVVVVDDTVYGIYRIGAVLKEATNFELASPAMRLFNSNRKRDEVASRRYELINVTSAATGLAVVGWSNRSRTAVQRSDGGFFFEILVDASLHKRPAEDVARDLAARIEQSRKGSAEERRKRLESATGMPRTIDVTARVFVRNADVIVEVLLRAAGFCELCGSRAPFTRKFDNTPYLEVHHREQLSKGGLDTIGNALAVCPNCHRHEHFG